jgi:hypothetical protein
LIRCCEPGDFELIWTIVNDGAQAYKGSIPPDCWTEPYMSRSELQHELDAGVAFWAYEEDGMLLGVMGLQQVSDVALIRHAYVRSSCQKRGRTWADAAWAIRFYEKHGFHIVSRDEKERLLRKYWTISERQIETSVVLADTKWRQIADSRA